MCLNPLEGAAGPPDVPDTPSEAPMTLRRFAVLVLVFLAPALRADQTQTAVPPPAEVKAAFLKLLDRPRLPLDPKEQDAPVEKDGLVTEHLTFASEKKADGTVERVPLLLVRPAVKPGAKLPAVLALHGTGGNKEGQL